MKVSYFTTIFILVWSLFSIQGFATEKIWDAYIRVSFDGDITPAEQDQFDVQLAGSAKGQGKGHTYGNLNVNTFKYDKQTHIIHVNMKGDFDNTKHAATYDFNKQLKTISSLYPYPIYTDHSRLKKPLFPDLQEDNFGPEKLNFVIPIKLFTSKSNSSSINFLLGMDGDNKKSSHNWYLGLSEKTVSFSPDDNKNNFKGLFYFTYNNYSFAFRPLNDHNKFEIVVAKETKKIYGFDKIRVSNVEFQSNHHGHPHINVSYNLHSLNIPLEAKNKYYNIREGLKIGKESQSYKISIISQRISSKDIGTIIKDYITPPNSSKTFPSGFYPYTIALAYDFSYFKDAPNFVAFMDLYFNNNFNIGGISESQKEQIKQIYCPDIGLAQETLVDNKNCSNGICYPSIWGIASRTGVDHGDKIECYMLGNNGIQLGRIKTKFSTQFDIGKGINPSSTFRKNNLFIVKFTDPKFN